jgi:peptide/nickel transport system substrate-binding protein
LQSLSRRYFAVVIIVAAAVVCASGCGGRQPIAPATIRVGIGAPQQVSRQSGVGVVITNAITETWLAGKPDGHQSERIVTDWSWDKTYTTLHLKIRDDVYFHDGTKLTSDIAAQVLRHTQANARTEGALGFLSVKSVNVTGPNDLDLHLSEPNSFVLTDLAWATVRKPDNPNIGTGPFMLTKQDQGRAILSAFPNYYRGRPGLSQIDMVGYKTQRSAWAALLRGDIDMLYDVSRDAVDFVSAESTVRTYKAPRPYYIFLGFNVRNPILKNVKVRKAINEALDRATLVHEGLNDRGSPAYGPIWPEHWARPKEMPEFSYKPDDARRLLDEAGFKAPLNAAGEMPSRFSFTCILYDEDTRFERIAMLVQKQLADVGIEMKLRPLKAKDLAEPLGKGNFDAAIVEFLGRSLSFVYESWHHHDGALLDSGYVAADGPLDRIREARSDEEIKAAVADLTRMLHDDPPAAFLAWQTTTRAVSTRFDVEAEKDRDILSNIWQWRAVAAPTQASR